MLAINTLLQNRYLIVRQIGKGGMGAVYEARHQQLKNTVAVKQTLAPDEMLRKALEHEAQLLANLRHPALPKVIDHFTEGDSQFMVMEYIAGKDLAEMLQERGASFPYQLVMNWGVQLLEVLDYLHAHEPPIIHRDIKPNNLKLTARGELILLDFGLSKGSAFTSSITSNKSLFGYSLNYAPPEQMQGQGTDARSDLYSVGATLYHLLTNTAPPDAMTRAISLASGHSDVLRWANEVNPAVPREVAAVLHSSMAIQREQRPPTAQVMRDVLQNGLQSMSGQRSESQPFAYPSTPQSNVPQTPQQATHNVMNISGTMSQENEETWKRAEPAPQRFAPANPVIQGNSGDQPFRVVEPVTQNVNPRPFEQTRPEGNLYRYSDSKNTIFAGQERDDGEAANRRKWMIIAAMAFVVIACGAVLFLVMNSSTKTAVSNSNVSPPSVVGPTSPSPDSEGKKTNPALAPATTTPQTSGKQEKKEPAQPPVNQEKKEATSPAPAEEQHATQPDSSPKVVRKAGGVLSGSATRRVEPTYPPLAKAARVSGAVVVEVTVDEQGNVMSATAISGHPLLKDAAVAAARGWKFTPTQLSGQPVKVIGTITFNFNM